MSELITEIARVMQGEVDALSHVAQNSANVNTPGFKTFRTAMEGTGLSQLSAENRAEVGRVIRLDLSFGGLAQTGRSTDLALSGEGWFVVQTPDGDRLTRNGTFHLDDAGVLMSVDGHPVVSTGDAEIAIPEGRFIVTGDGHVKVDQKDIAQLKIVSLENSRQLQSVGNGQFIVQGATVPSDKPGVIQGALEMSNVDTSTEMVRLIERTRYIEALQRAMSSYDDLLSIGVNQIGK